MAFWSWSSKLVIKCTKCSGNLTPLDKMPKPWFINQFISRSLWRKSCKSIFFSLKQIKRFFFLEGERPALTLWLFIAKYITYQWKSISNSLNDWCYVAWNCIPCNKQVYSSYLIEEIQSFGHIIMNNPCVVLIWFCKYTFYTPALDHAILKSNVFKATIKYKIANYLNKTKQNNHFLHIFQLH